MNIDRSIWKFVLAAMLATTSVSIAWAHEDEEENEKEHIHPPVVENAKWKNECGSCHVAYPPGLLPAESWNAIMDDLDMHFGNNAYVDRADSKEIRDFLVKNADTRQYKKTDKPLLRITETDWFVSEHRKVPRQVWQNSKVQSPSNCGACHTLAEKGDYRERNVKLPK